MPSQTFQPTEVDYKELYDDPEKKEKEKKEKEKEAKEKEKEKEAKEKDMDPTSAPTSSDYDHIGKAGEPDGGAVYRPKPPVPPGSR